MNHSKLDTEKNNSCPSGILITIAFAILSLTIFSNVLQAETEASITDSELQEISTAISTSQDDAITLNALNALDDSELKLPTAGFEYSAEGLNVTFTDLSTDDSTLVLWSWNFGDGGSSQEQNPIHEYANSGTYTVSLTVFNDVGELNSSTQSVTVTDQVNEAPMAGFDFVINELNVSFNDTSSDSDGTIVLWNWNFGDGGSSSEQNPVYDYGVAGTYDVSLTVIDELGGLDTVTQSVTVSVLVNESPIAGFDSEATNLSVSFSDTSSDSDGSIISWDWDFGDGGSSSERNPNYDYAAAGSYDVTLTVFDDGGASDTLTQGVTVADAVNELPVAAFSSSSDGLEVTFTDESVDNDGTIVAWDWDFGDSTFSDVQNPVHIYLVDGSYTVTLTVTDSDGEQSSSFEQVTVEAPESDIKAKAYIFNCWNYSKIILRWKGANGRKVDIYENGELYQTTHNDNYWSEWRTPPITSSFQVCEAGTSNCSLEVTP